MQMTYPANLIFCSNVKNWLFSLTDAFGMDVLDAGMRQRLAANFGMPKFKGISSGTHLWLDC